MAATPSWKVYDAAGKYQAACHEAEAAACLVALYGNGATIRHSHGPALWTEGSEIESAGNSYDGCARVIIERQRARSRTLIDKAYGAGTAARWEAERKA